MNVSPTILEQAITTPTHLQPPSETSQTHLLANSPLAGYAPALQESTATVPARPGLVQLLTTYPGSLPGLDEIPVALTGRLLNEVVDHLDCSKLSELPLAAMDEAWLLSFTEHLETFYTPVRAAYYVKALQLLVACDNDAPAIHW